MRVVHIDRSLLAGLCRVSLIGPWDGKLSRMGPEKSKRCGEGRRICC